MLHRRVGEEFDCANRYARILQRFPEGPLDAQGEALHEEIVARWATAESTLVSRA